MSIRCSNARALARGLSPVQVAGGSLSLALSRLAAEVSAGGSIDVVCRSELADLHLGALLSDHPYRIAQECLRICANQPDCRKIAIELRLTHEALVLRSVGDREALTQRRAEDERGWGTIAYLARVFGGTARVEGLAVGGTRCIVSIPLETLAAGLDAPAPALVLSPS